MDTIGMASMSDHGDALHAEFEFADTQAARETQELMRLGAITDVSAGILITDEVPMKGGDIALTGEMDHVAIVRHGAFAEHGSKVLEVHSKEESMGIEEETTPTLELANSKEFIKLEAETELLRAQVTELMIPGNIKEPTQEFSDLRDFLLTFSGANKGDSKARQRMEEFVLADDTTTTATGLVPDYFSRDIIGLIHTERPYVSAVPVDPIGDHGMTLQYPVRTQKPDVDVQAAEKTEVASQPTTFIFDTVDLVTYAGASDVALQLIERSAPSFVDRLFQEYAGVYAEKTDGDAVAAAVTGAGNTAILADLGADAAATWAAIALASTTIYTATRKSPNVLILAPDRWGQLISLTDTDGRPLVVLTPQGPTNAQGTGGGFNSVIANYNGLNVIVDANAAVGTCIVMWTGAAVTIEQTPQQLRALQVSLLGMDMGVWGLFAHYVKYADGIYTLTLA